ncbi:MAG: FtsW/RodA/SpoVE family cell cycle protein, partial [Halofilum sp. (in: g-proteobacteria)]
MAETTLAASSQNSPLNRLLLALRLDPPLMFGVAAICAVGMLALYSSGGQSLSLLTQQGVRLALGLGAMLVVAQIPPRNLWLLTPWAYIGGIALLVWVLVDGAVSGGAQRWLDLGLVRVQPSEAMKLAVPMMVAWYLGDRAMPPSLQRVFAALVLAAIPVLLIARQPDLGTAVLVASAGCFVLFLAGIGWRLIGTMAAVTAAAVPVLWHFMADYQRQRVLTFFHPESDPLGSGYHIIQSKIAIGSGGLYGKGWLNGTQSHPDFLPERSTDFI